MSKLIKYGLIFFGSIIALIIVAMIAAPLFFDPNDYKAQIIEQVETKTGRTFQLDGELKLSVFPWLGIEIGGLTVGNASGFGEQPMLSTGLVQARVRLLPLLSKEVEMSTLVLEDANVLLMRDPSGKTNWDDLLARDDEKQAESKQDDDKQKGDEAGGLVLASLTLGGIKLENANLVWDDQSTDQYYAVKGMNLKTGKLALNEPVDLDVALDFDARAEKIKGALEMQSTIAYDLEKKKYRLTPFQFNAELQGQSIPGGAADIRMTAKAIHADLMQATASVEDLFLKAKDNKIEGNISARQIFDAVPLADGNINIQAAGLAEVLAAMGLDPANVPVKSLVAESTFSSEKEAITFQELAIKAVLAGGEIVQPVDVKLNAGGTYDTVGKGLNLQRFALESPGASLSGSVAVNNITAQIPLVNGKINLQADNVHELLKALGQDIAKMPLTKFSAQATIDSRNDMIKIAPLIAKATLEGAQIPDQRADVNLQTNADVNVERETLNLTNLSIQGMGLDMQVSIKGTQIINNPKVAGRLVLASFNLRRLLQAMQMEVPETADAKAMSSVSLKTDFSGGKNALQIKNMRLKLDETSVNGDFDIVNFDAPATTFNLAINSIDADRYLPPLKKGEKPKPLTPGTAAATAVEQLPIDALRKLKVNGNLNIGKLIVSKAKLNKVQLGLKAKGGKINLHPAKAELYNGSYSGNARIDATGNQPELFLTSAIQNLNAGPLLEDMQIQSNIEGIMNSDVTIHATGADAEMIKQNLTGDAKFTFTDGAIKGVNIGRLVREVDAAINGKKLPADNEPLQTDFSEMSASFTIANGLISNPDLIIKSPLFRVEGNGEADLVSEKIDYSVTASLVRSSKGQGGEEPSELAGIPIPIKVTGTFAKPQYAPDVTEVAKILAQKKLQKKLDKILPKELNGLSGLLGGKPKATDQPAGGEDTSAPSATDSTTTQQSDQEKPKTEDVLKDQLKKLLKF